MSSLCEVYQHPPQRQELWHSRGKEKAELATAFTELIDLLTTVLSLLTCGEAEEGIQPNWVFLPTEIILEKAQEFVILLLSVQYYGVGIICSSTMGGECLFKSRIFPEA